ncbi:MAG: DNA polymerase III subunit delta [Candidatus Marinimicrobia bacterium]|nr:DNA polymerase III subunit delta [Candidatus Neomarinimicrobiota bacterium]MBL7023467.1 DNA polymerase III subunit delta [Candidatus Neomarinimicrobiota bacterium]MBL7109278.1 DNA polymerase III subunit delta [Candidatus Neomarinimicrobiota bacterium]
MKKYTKQPSLGQIIRRVHSNELASVYCIFGNDAFLQDYFINEVSNKFLNGKGVKLHFTMDDDSESHLFGELATFSLFEEKRVFIIRQPKKISQRFRDELLEYLDNPKSCNLLLLISEEFDLKNAFLRNLSNKSTLVNVRAPFENEFKQWVNYFASKRNIKIAPDALNLLLELHGDSIANVFNEMEKISLVIDENTIIDVATINKISGLQREYHLWQLQESMGKKDLNMSIRIFSSLNENGVKLPQIIIGLSNLYQQMIWKIMGNDKSSGWTGLNAIITRELGNFQRNYNPKEIMDALRNLRKADLLTKTTSLSEVKILQPIIIKICKGIYA